MKTKTFIITAALMLFMLPLNVHAADTEITGDGSASATVTKTVSSSYSVLIPKAIDLGSASSSNITVQAKGNIAPDKKLDITTDATVSMERANDDSYSSDATVTLSGASWNSTALTDAYTSKTGTISFGETKAGSYTGTLNFTIALNNKG